MARGVHVFVLHCDGVVVNLVVHIQQERGGGHREVAAERKFRAGFIIHAVLGIEVGVERVGAVADVADLLIHEWEAIDHAGAREKLRVRIELIKQRGLGHVGVVRLRIVETAASRFGDVGADAALLGARTDAERQLVHQFQLVTAIYADNAFIHRAIERQCGARVVAVAVDAQPIKVRVHAEQKQIVMPSDFIF